MPCFQVLFPSCETFGKKHTSLHSNLRSSDQTGNDEGTGHQKHRRTVLRHPRRISPQETIEHSSKKPARSRTQKTRGETALQKQTVHHHARLPRSRLLAPLCSSRR